MLTIAPDLNSLEEDTHAHEILYGLQFGLEQHFVVEQPAQFGGHTRL